MAPAPPSISRRFGGRPWIAWIAGAVVAGLTAGCAADTEPAAAASEDDEIFGGVRDDDGSAEPRVVALRIDTGGDDFEICSGALVAPNVILTAKHCVTERIGSVVACDEDGRSMNGAQVGPQVSPSSIAVFAGASPSYFREPSALVRSIFAPEGPALCDADIALVVLDRAIEDLEPFALRFAAHARVGERIRAVGYGENDAKTPIGTRFRREHVPVLAVGSQVTKSKTRLGPREFEVGKSICTGDSGGPAISEITGAIIGVVSRGSSCSSDSGHVYTSSSGFDDLFARAFEAAGASTKPLVEANTPPEDVAASPLSSAGDETSSEDQTSAQATGCAAAPGAPGGSAATVLALAAIAASFKRRGKRR